MWHVFRPAHILLSLAMEFTFRLVCVNLFRQSFGFTSRIFCITLFSLSIVFESVWAFFRHFGRLFLICGAPIALSERSQHSADSILCAYSMHSASNSFFKEKYALRGVQVELRRPAGAFWEQYWHVIDISRLCRSLHFWLCWTMQQYR